MSISGIIFDFDGVIADTEHLHLAATREALATRGWALTESEYFQRYIGCDDRGLIVAYARDHRLELSEEDTEALLRAKMVAFSRHLSSPDLLYPGAKSAIQRLASRFAIAIASGALRQEICAILATADLLDLFSVIVGADDVTESKPAPGPYLAAAERMGLLPRECVAIEDTVPGLQAARAAGMRTIAVTTTSPRDALAAADRVVTGLQEVSVELVAALGPRPGLW